MEKLIAEFPNNLSEALQIAQSANFKIPTMKIENVVICGMGGSGIGGKLVSKWVEDEIKLPITHSHDYSIPAFVSENTLVIGSSYSGNTEETLACVEEAMLKGAHIVCVCSGGELAEICRNNNYDVVIVPGGNPPRTALAFSLVQLLNIFMKLGMIGAKSLSDIAAARELIVSNEKEIKEEAHKLAEFLKGSVGILYGTTKYEAVLVRARQQFNENSKLLCWHHTLPEMNHNELVGWGGGDNRFSVVFFETDDIHPRNARRLQITKEVISQKTENIYTLRGIGNSTIEKSIYLINVVDWASLYLSDLSNVDPIDIAVIDMLKSELAAFN